MRSPYRFAPLFFAFLFYAALPAFAADYPQPKEGDWVVRDFRFHTGEVFPEVKLHYTTIGAPSGEPVLILHGTAGSGANMLTNDFAGELFGPGQPLDASRYYIILPDALGTGKSTRPSDGLRAKFPRYNYDDMVLAQYRLVTEGLGVKHLRLVLGNSMGGMQAWIWGTRYPDFMDALVPMACLPVAMSGRNWMLRRMLTQSIRNDPEWNNGNYTAQPRDMQTHLLYYGLATIGGNQALYKQAPTAAKATSSSPSGSRSPSAATPTTSCTSGNRRTTTIRRRAWSASRPRCSRSTRPTTSATRRSSASWSARSSASGTAATC